MSWWDTTILPASAGTYSHTDLNQLKTESSNGRLISRIHNTKLLPLPEAVNLHQTPLNDRFVRLFVTAFKQSVLQANPQPLKELLHNLNVREISVDNAIPAGRRQIAKSLSKRSISVVDQEKIRHLAMQLIEQHMPVKSLTKTSTVSGTHPAWTNSRRRNSGKKVPHGSESNYIRDKVNTAPDSIEQKEMEQGLDSTRDTPNKGRNIT